MDEATTGVILAAGRGSRLAPLTDDRPKPLIEIGGMPCLAHAIRALAPTVQEILVVVGYQARRVEEWLRTTRHPLPVRSVINPSYERGSLSSLAAARCLLADKGFIVTNADHIFPEDFFLVHFQPCENNEICIAAQRDRKIMDDEMKIRLDSANRLCAISKQLAVYDGAYIGATRVPASAAAAYWRGFDIAAAEAGSKVANVEDVLSVLAGSPDSPRVVWCNTVRWYEVDTPEDLARARQAFEER